MTIKYELKGSISSTHFGYAKLLDVYRFCKKYNNCTIMICFRNCSWFDANMSAVLRAILYKLREENNIKFYSEKKYADKFPILISNGFFKSNNDRIIKYSTGTEVKLREFDKKQDQEYYEYVENDLLNHSGIKIDSNTKYYISECLIEAFGNFEIHSKKEYPLFVCGQYYPKKKLFIFTIQDLGVGFLNPISELHPAIDTYEKAIKWAIIKGNTTKSGIPGGLGMDELKSNMMNVGGKFEVISGDCYHTCECKDGKVIDNYKKINCDYIGSTINLVF